MTDRQNDPGVERSAVRGWWRAVDIEDPVARILLLVYRDAHGVNEDGRVVRESCVSKLQHAGRLGCSESEAYLSVGTQTAQSAAIAVRS